MPISIADLARDRRSFNMDTSFGPVRITYRPYQMTPAREAEIERIASESVEDEDDNEVRESERGINKLISQFCEVVESTDLVGPLHARIDPDGVGIGEPVVAAGEPIPITPAYVKYFSSAFIVQMLQAVAQDVRPKKRRRED